MATYTEAEYLALEERNEVRHEPVGGRIYRKPGGTERHELAVAALLTCVRPGARAAGCRAFAHRQLRVPAGDHYYPDVMVACGPTANLMYAEQPAVTFEVLSPPTIAEDRRGTLRAYLTCQSLQRYILVDPVFRRFEVFKADTWHSPGPGEVVETGFGPLAIDEFYDELDTDATT